MVLFNKERQYDPADHASHKSLIECLTIDRYDSTLARLTTRLIRDGYTLTPAQGDFESQISGGRLIAAYADCLVFETARSERWNGDLVGLERRSVEGEAFVYLVTDRVGRMSWRIKPVSLGVENLNHSMQCTIRVAYLPLSEPEKPKEPPKGGITTGT